MEYEQTDILWGSFRTLRQRLILHSHRVSSQIWAFKADFGELWFAQPGPCSDPPRVPWAKGCFLLLCLSP